MSVILGRLLFPALVVIRLIRYSNILAASRVIFLRSLGAKVGKNVTIRPFVIFKGIRNIDIGDNVYIGEGSILVGNGGNIKIGSNVMIAENVYISTQNHKFRDPIVLMKAQGYKNAPVLIGDNVWLAHSSVVLAGTTIRSGSVVAANAVSPKDVDHNSLVRTPSAVVEKIGHQHAE